MDGHTINLLKEAIARTRHELGDRAAAPGSQDSWQGWTPNGDGVTREEAREITELVRSFTRK